MNRPYSNGNRDPRRNRNLGKVNSSQQKSKVDFNHTVESTTGINLKVDITYFSFRDMEKFNQELKVIGVNELSVSKRFQNELAWINLPDTSKISKIQEIYHSIVIDTVLGKDVELDQGIKIMPSNISGNILSDVLVKLEDGEKMVHRGAIGLSDISMDFYAGGKFNDSVPLEDGYFHYYEGDYLAKGEYIQHDLSVEFPEEQTNRRCNRYAVTTQPLKSAKHEFKLRPNHKAIVITYKFIDVIEKYEGVFLPIYEIIPYYFNQPVSGSARMTFGKPIKRVDTLISIMKEYQNQGFGYMTRAAIIDLKLITEHDVNNLLNSRGVDARFVIDIDDGVRKNTQKKTNSTNDKKGPKKTANNKPSKFEIQDSDMTAPVEENLTENVEEKESLTTVIETVTECTEQSTPVETKKEETVEDQIASE